MESPREQLVDRIEAANRQVQQLSDLVQELKQNVSRSVCIRSYDDIGTVEGNKVVSINPADGEGNVEVVCQLNPDDRAWTVFQHRFDGSVDFYRKDRPGAEALLPR